MKKIFLTMLFALSICTTFGFETNKPVFDLIENVGDKISIKLKNDTDAEVTVINSAGGTYKLQKNIVTTVKMDEGDKLWYYVKGKKADLILTATADMDGKLQLVSKF